MCSSYILLFTEDAADSLLCPLDYFLANGCTDLTYRRPYPIQRHLSARSWPAARAEGDSIRLEFIRQLIEDLQDP